MLNKYVMNKDDENQASTEELILRAAENEFLSKGYEGARTTTIAAEAGVTHAMLHYYFRTKENLFDKVMADKVDMLQNILLCFFKDEDVDLFYRLRLGMERHFDLVAANPDLPLFVIGEAKRGGDILKRTMRKAFTKSPEMLVDLQRQIDEGAERGENAKVDAFMLVMDIVSLNLMAVMALNLIPIVGLPVEKEAFLRMRKDENITTIMKRLRP